MLWTAKALQRMIRLAQSITRTELPAIQHLHTLFCRRKADKLISDLCRPSYTLFMLLPSASRYRGIWTRTSKFKNTFYPQAIRILNCLKNWTPEFSLMHCCHLRPKSIPDRSLLFHHVVLFLFYFYLFVYFIWGGEQFSVTPKQLKKTQNEGEKIVPYQYVNKLNVLCIRWNSETDL